MDRDMEIMAKTIYGEARGECVEKKATLASFAPLIAIGNVIMNRSKESSTSIASVCLAPKQFSCWNENDPNRKVIERVTLKDPIFTRCFIVGAKIICEELKDITYGANHYYSRYLKKPPYWAEGRTPVVKIGNHIFFKL
ncbi:MAG: cell wall hydrolase [Holosporales bacterium]|jgi:spore germination cell wall hydrolase CwlJ-like protein|nr:cell wall hydrolase [Holosporales bacterium]